MPVLSAGVILHQAPLTKAASHVTKHLLSSNTINFFCDITHLAMDMVRHKPPSVSMQSCLEV